MHRPEICGCRPNCAAIETHFQIGFRNKLFQLFLKGIDRCGLRARRRVASSDLKWRVSGRICNGDDSNAGRSHGRHTRIGPRGGACNRLVLAYADQTLPGPEARWKEGPRRRGRRVQADVRTKRRGHGCFRPPLLRSRKG